MGCCVPGCTAEVWVQKSQLCSRHYSRQRETGTTDDGPKARGSATERFWRNVEKRGPDECWPWKGNAKVDGYGYMGLGGRNDGKVLAHRASWIIHNGSIPEAPEYHGVVVRHRCDNRGCVNPAHLDIGTQSDNVRDMVERGRVVVPALKGSKHPNSRFTDDDIRYIRSSTKPNAELGRQFNCERSVISNIRMRKSWKHLP